MKKIALEANVYCSDQWCGLVTEILVNPQTQRVSHLVVKEGVVPHIERLVPIDAVSKTSPERIQLRCSPDEFKHLDPFVQIEHHSELIPDYENAAYLNGMWTYVPEKRVWVETGWKQIPSGELALQQGALVQATDGPVGKVTGLGVEPTTRRIKSLVIEQGLPWDRRHIAVPVANVERADEKVVYLKLDKHSVDALASDRTTQNLKRNRPLAEQF
jgi:sporulation protein YlmC with PRC-barrel domain